jgi:conjugative transfer protein TraD
MPRNRKTLEEQKVAAIQRLDRIQEREAKIAGRERKAENHRKFVFGGLVLKAGLGEWPPETVLGGLLALRQAAEKSPDQMAAWAKAGIAEIGELPGPAGKIVIVRFPEEPSRELRQRLRSAGLRWNRIALQWEAIADPDAITALIQGSGGTLEVRESSATVAGP